MTTTPAAPTVVARLDAAPSPRVDITATMPPDALSFTIYRTANGERVAVRGAYRAPSGGPAVTDYEAPFGVPVTYAVETYDASGTPSQLSPPSGAVTLVVSSIWLSDPLAPESAVEVDPCFDGEETIALAGTFATLTYASTGSTIPVVGSSLPVGIGGVRQAASAIPFDFYTRTVSASDSLLQLVRQAYPLLMRTPAEFTMFTGALYLALSDLVRDPQRYVNPLGYWSDRWSMTADRVQRPSADVVLSVRTWDDIPGEAATWDALTQRYETWVDVMQGS